MKTTVTTAVHQTIIVALVTIIKVVKIIMITIIELITLNLKIIANDSGGTTTTN